MKVSICVRLLSVDRGGHAVPFLHQQRVQEWKAVILLLLSGELDGLSLRLFM